jgi:hypothetical protein
MVQNVQGFVPRFAAFDEMLWEGHAITEGRAVGNPAGRTCSDAQGRCKMRNPGLFLRLKFEPESYSGKESSVQHMRILDELSCALYNHTC